MSFLDLLEHSPGNTENIRVNYEILHNPTIVKKEKNQELTLLKVTSMVFGGLGYCNW